MAAEGIEHHPVAIGHSRSHAEWFSVCALSITPDTAAEGLPEESWGLSLGTNRPEREPLPPSIAVLLQAGFL
jgi:hypothetical protein